jgi:hypothetical protein
VLKATKVEKGDVAVKKCDVAFNNVFIFEDMAAGVTTLPLKRG